MAEIEQNSANVAALRALDEAAALAWLRAQPDGTTTLPAAALARRWGWPEHRARRRLNAWQKTGLVRRRGRAVTVVGEAVGSAVGPTVNPTPNPTSDTVVGKPNHAVDITWKQSPSVRRAAQLAGQAAAVIDFPVVRQFVEPLSESATDIPEDISGREIMPAPVAQRSKRLDDQTWPAPSHGRPLLKTVLYCSALGLAAVSGGYSITGLTHIFIGAFWPVIAMGVALEVGKLSAVSALPTLRWGGLKVALVALVAVLMGLNAVGCYGFLARSQIEHSVFADAAIEARETQVRARSEAQAGVLADLDRRIAQIDKAVETATQRGRTNSAMALAQDQKRNRADLVRDRQHQAEVLADMKTEEGGLSVHRRAVAAADLGPVRYLAALIGVPPDEVLRWFVLLVACLLDPAAVVLLLTASSQRRGP
jgi:hypothetical protein